MIKYMVKYQQRIISNYQLYIGVDFMNIKHGIEMRSSSRKYTSDLISSEIINEILSAASWAPSPKNRQPWRFAILQGDAKKELVKECRKQLSGNSSHIDYLMYNEFASETHTFNIIGQAPVLILVFNIYPSQKALNHSDKSFDNMNIQAIGAAIQNMLLRATELGINSLWVGDIISIENWILKKFPDAGSLVSGVVLGVSPKENLSRTERLPISELVIYNGG